MRGPIDSKSKTCTERMEVDAAGISVKVSGSYPGRSDSLSRGIGTTGIERCREGLSEVSRGHIRLARPSQRPEHEQQDWSLTFDGKGAAEQQG